MELVERHKLYVRTYPPPLLEITVELVGGVKEEDKRFT